MPRRVLGISGFDRKACAFQHLYVFSNFGKKYILCFLKSIECGLIFVGIQERERGRERSVLLFGCQQLFTLGSTKLRQVVVVAYFFSARKLKILW